MTYEVDGIARAAKKNRKSREIWATLLEKVEGVSWIKQKGPVLFFKERAESASKHDDLPPNLEILIEKGRLSAA